MGITIGIDLGTTNSCVAVLDDGDAVIVENAEGKRTTPSVVAFTEEVLLGSAARRQAVLNPERTISSIKRFMGRKIQEVTEEEKMISYPIRADEDGNVRIDIAGRLSSPQEISAMILEKLKNDTASRLGKEVTSAIITVPAYFNDAQRQATKEAGRLAGLDVKRILNEPTAAALAYGLDKSEEGTVLVFDLGGGTLDVSVLEMSDGLIEVLATAGDNQLGGDNFDKAIVDWLVAGFHAKEGIDVSSDKRVLQRLYEAAEKAKTELSSASETVIQIPFLCAREGEPLHLEMKLTRAEFEKISHSLLERITHPLKQAILDASTPINHVVLVGGMSRVPAIQRMVERITGKSPYRGINPDEVVARGAAVQGGIIDGGMKELLLLDVTPLSLGIETKGGIMTRLIERNTTVPTHIEQIFSTAEDKQNSVEIHILQGERQMAEGNKSLGRFQLTGIPPAPRGVPQIEVAFRIDVDGILEVSARDKSSGKEQEVKIEGSSKLSEEEIEEALTRAKMSHAEDLKARDLAEAKNIAQATIYNTKQVIEELSLRSPEVDLIDEAIASLENDLTGSDLLAIRQGSAELENIMQARSDRIYEEVKKQNGPLPSSIEVIDAAVLHEED
jgi:molecular chaperone DnaK